MRAVLITLMLVAALSGCTMLYKREYVTESPQQLSPQETAEVFRAFRDYLLIRGMQPLGHKSPEELDRSVAFRIAGSDAGFALRGDWEDILELSYSGGSNFQLRLFRMVHRPGADFSDEYLKRFVERSEEYLREATKRPIRLRLVPSPT